MRTARSHGHHRQLTPPLAGPTHHRPRSACPPLHQHQPKSRSGACSCAWRQTEARAGASRHCQHHCLECRLLRQPQAARPSRNCWVFQIKRPQRSTCAPSAMRRAYAPTSGRAARRARRRRCSHLSAHFAVRSATLAVERRRGGRRAECPAVCPATCAPAAAARSGWSTSRAPSGREVPPRCAATRTRLAAAWPATGATLAPDEVCH